MKYGQNNSDPGTRFTFSRNYLANIYLFKVNNRNTRKKCNICSKVTIKTPEQHQ